MCYSCLLKAAFALLNSQLHKKLKTGGVFKCVCVCVCVCVVQLDTTCESLLKCTDKEITYIYQSASLLQSVLEMRIVPLLKELHQWQFS